MIFEKHPRNGLIPLFIALQWSYVRKIKRYLTPRKFVN